MKEDPKMGEDDKMKSNESVKGDNDLEIIKDSSQRVRLDSYVNIENDEIFEEKNEAQKGTPKQKDDSTNINEITGIIYKDRCKSLSDLFPCGVCGDDLGKRFKGKSVLCMGCMHWCHLTKCSGLNSEKDYKKKDYRCPTCFGQYSDVPQKEDTEISLNRRDKYCNKENLDKNKNFTEIKKTGGRRVSFFDNSPIITGGREFPETKRKRKTREDETLDSSEKKTDAEKSPISKKTKIKEIKKNDKTKLNNASKHEITTEPCKTQQNDVQIPTDVNRLKECIDCNQSYIADYSNKDENNCVGCNASRHDCRKELDIKKDYGKASKGSVWICSDCMKMFQKENTTKNKETLDNIGNMSKNSKTQPEKPNEINESSANLLEYQGINITSEDINTLDNGKWVSDEIIAIFLAFMREDPTMNANKILLVNPTTSFLLKECENKKVVHDLKNELQINEMEWVFYPINNNEKTDSVGGTHWSLLMFCKKENKYYHYDPIEGMNKDHAKKLVINIIDMCNFGAKGLPDYKEIKCPQQDNTFDCGPFVMLYIQKLTNYLISGKEPNIYKVHRDEATKLREQLQEIIHFRISKSVPIVTLSDETKIPNDSSVVETNKKTKVCDKWARNICYKLEDCTYDHPALCKSWISRGDCFGKKTNQCKFYHPDLCWQFLGQGKCNKENKCLYRHIQDVERNIFKSNHSNSNYRKEVCRYWAAGKCLKKFCNFTHPIICRDILRTGHCNLKSCNKFHPQICDANRNNERCRWGNNCRFRHINKFTSNEDYIQLYRKPNIENPRGYTRMQQDDNSRDREQYFSHNQERTEHYGIPNKANTEDFLWSRLNAWEKREIIGLMSHTMTGKTLRK